jgi:hypothetical protein
MVVPNYTNLKLKMPDSKGVITVEGNFEQTYYYEQDCITQATTLVAPMLQVASATMQEGHQRKE